MPALIALTISVGVLALIDTWLYFGPLASTALAGLVWISFVAWGCHFHSGGGTRGSLATVVCMTWGAIVGMVAVMLAAAVIVIFGFINMARGGSGDVSQRLMRARVVAQAVAIALLMAALFFFGGNHGTPGN